MLDWVDQTPKCIQQGNSGSIFKVHCVDFGSAIYIKKQFKEGKCIQKFIKEVEYQQRASERGIAPNIVDISLGVPGLCYKKQCEGPFFVMEYCELPLLDFMHSQGGLFDYQLEKIQSLYADLDRIKIIHNDANLANIMVYMKDGCTVPRFNIIDFGMAKDGSSNTHSFRLLKFRIKRELAFIDTPSKS